MLSFMKQVKSLLKEMHTSQRSADKICEENSLWPVSQNSAMKNGKQVLMEE